MSPASDKSAGLADFRNLRALLSAASHFQYIEGAAFVDDFSVQLFAPTQDDLVLGAALGVIE